MIFQRIAFWGAIFAGIKSVFPWDNSLCKTAFAAGKEISGKMYDGYFSHAIPSSVDGNDIPLGMGEAFSKNLSALAEFAKLSPTEQAELISKARNVKSEEEMTALINSVYN